MQIGRRIIHGVAGGLVGGLLLMATLARAAEAVVTPGTRLAIVGDSITEQKLYSKYLEAYLLACSGIPDVRVFQFGWSGETAGGFLNRLENDLGVLRPTVVTLCYGMNDGGYQPFKESIGTNYENNMSAIVERLNKLDVKTIVVGSPGAVDTHFFRPGQVMGPDPAHVAYNQTLGKLRDIDRRLAENTQQRFADVHQTMLDAMQRAQAKLGDKYDVCGRDGFHPGPNGQLLMAYAFLKALDVRGDIGEIVVDGSTVTVSNGHRVVRSEGTVVDLSSTRWPFCFDADPTSSNSTRSITPFVPFNADLNRLTLRVPNLLSARARITWGEANAEFTKEQLAAGINLMSEFPKTPFDAAFMKLLDAIAAKQSFETYMVKSVLTNFRGMPKELKSDAEMQSATQTILNRLLARHQQLETAARATLVPVEHRLKIEPLP